MARASYIYIATDGKVLAAFTVKYECADWFQEQSASYQRACQVYRVPDGRQAEPTLIPKEELV